MTFYLLDPYHIGWRRERGVFVGPMTLRWWRTGPTIYIAPDWYPNYGPYLAPEHWYARPSH